MRRSLASARKPHQVTPLQLSTFEKCVELTPYSPDIKKHKLTSHCLVSLLCLKNHSLERKFVGPLFHPFTLHVPFSHPFIPPCSLSPTLSSLHAPSLPSLHPSMLPLSQPFIPLCSLLPSLPKCLLG